MARRLGHISAEGRLHIANKERAMWTERANPHRPYEATCITCGHMRWRHWTDREVELIALLKVQCGRCGSTLVEIEQIDIRDSFVPGNMAECGIDK